MWIDRLMKHTDSVEFRREPTLAMVARISTCWLDTHLGTPLEMHARTVAQFQGMAQTRSIWQRGLRRLASMALLVHFFGENLIRGLNQPGENEEPELVDGVKTGGELREYELPPEFAHSRMRSWSSRPSFLPWREVGAVVRGFLAVGCWEPEVYCKSLLALSAQEGLFKRYHPHFVLMYKEYDFVCSMLTWQCHLFGARAYNIMHGDKAYYARDAFFSVDRYYVWDRGYGEIARDMKADPGQVMVYTPDRMRPLEEGPAPCFDILVLLPAYAVDRGVEETWMDTLITLATRWKIRIRPHPRNPFNPRLHALTARKGMDMSDPRAEGALDAIRSVHAVVGLQSTMLIEALHQERLVYCIRDERLDQIRDYHPYFRDGKVQITTMHLLPGLIEADLT